MTEHLTLTWATLRDDIAAAAASNFRGLSEGELDDLESEILDEMLHAGLSVCQIPIESFRQLCVMFAHLPVGERV